MFTVADDEGLLQLYRTSNTRSPVTPRRFRQIGYFLEDVTIAQERVGQPLLLIDKSGNTVTSLDAYRGYPIRVMRNFSDGLALTYVGNGKYGYVNARGEWVIEPFYDCAYDFSEGVALVGVANERGEVAYQVINKQGEILFYVTLHDSQLQDVYACGLLVYTDLHQQYFACLDQKGKTVLYFPSGIQEVSHFRHGAALFLTSNGIGLCDKSGKILIPANFEEGEIIGPRRVALKSRGKWAIFDFGGKPLCEFSYDRVFPYDRDGYAFVAKDSVFVLVNREGKQVSKRTYFHIGWDEALSQGYPQVFGRYLEPEEPVVREDRQMLAPPKPSPTGIRAIDRNNPFYREAQKVLEGGLAETDAENRRTILNYMEHFRMSYNTKDIDFLEQLFSEDALIIVGTVVKKAPRQEGNYLSPGQISFNRRTKREYLERLKTIFRANKQIEVQFNDFLIRRHPTRPGIYGVSVRQSYSDRKSVV